MRRNFEDLVVYQYLAVSFAILEVKKLSLVLVGKIQPEPKKKSKLLWVILGIILVLLIAGGILLFILSRKEEGIVESIKSLFGRGEEAQEDESNLDVGEVVETDTDSEVGEEIIYAYFDCSDMWMADGWNSYTNDYWNYSLKHTKDIFVEEFNDTFSLDRTEFTVGYEPLIFILFQTFIKQTEDIDTQLATILTNTCTEEIRYSNVQYGTNTYRMATATSESESCLAGLGIETEKDRIAFAHELEEGIYFILRNDSYNLEQETELMCSIVFN
ncbi:hypothetical protein ACFLY9_02825 [Patescibacteria group bacterium]